MWLFIITIISFLRGSTGQSVKQTTGIMTVTEGQLVSLNCSYEAQFRDTHYLFWYIQPSDQPPESLLASYSKQAQQAQGFQATHIPHDNKQKGTFNMQKTAIQLKDSAVYFCALQEGVNTYSKIIFGSGTKLVVTPNLNVSEPSVYQLESKKESGDLAACLITDYSPDPINVKFNDNLDPVATNGSVVVVKDGDKESASLGVVLWSKNKDEFQCSAIYNDQTYKAEKEEDATCSETQSDTPVFETDERLNLLSLTVMGLRLIFFKSVALNLILTYWAWSR